MSAVRLNLAEPTWALEPEDRLGTRGGRVVRLVPLLASTAVMVGDLAVILGAFLLAYWARFVVPDAEAVALGIEQYVRVGLLVGAASVALLAMSGLYDHDRPPAWPARLRLIVSALSTALVLTVTLSVFLGDERFSRLWFATGWSFAVVGLVLWRTLVPRLYAAARDAVAPADRVLVVGANRLGERLAAELAGSHRVVGFVDNGSELERDGVLPPLLGPISQLEQLVYAHGISQLVIALPTDRRSQVFRIVARGFRRPVEVKFLPYADELLPRGVEIQHLGGRPYIGFASATRVTWVKRALDLVLSSIGLLVLAPCFVLVAAAIKLDSTGPVFYCQRRIGKDGRPFRMLKFRSMRKDAETLIEQLRDKNEASGPLFKMRNDPRITRVGRFIRRTSIDELPQLINVLKGEMSLVGPRPPVPSEVERYEDWQHGRLRAVPGITGLWQVSGRSEVSFHDMVRLDLHYVRSWSLALDLEILLRTIPAGLSNRGAY